MQKIVTIHAGHNPSKKTGCGAKGFLDESKEARYLKKRVIKILKKRKDIKVFDCTVNNGRSQGDVLKKIIEKTNKINADLNVSFHFNAFKTSKKDGFVKGCEICIYDKNNQFTKNIANNILKEMEKLGFTNRGIKERKDLGFLRRTNTQSILIEFCFVDDMDDYLLYTKKKDLIPNIIANSIRL